MTQTKKPWEDPDGSTNVDGFLAAYAADSNTYWRAETGHIQNVLDELIERVEHAEIVLNATADTDYRDEDA